MTMRAGFIGVGLMGHGMCRNLLAKGFPLTVMVHRNRAPVEDIVAHGGAEAPDAATLARASDVVFVCVTGAPEVEAVLNGPAGVLAGLRPGAIVVDCSTTTPDTAARTAAAVTACGGRFLDAPLSLGPREAEAGTLNIIVGGASEDLDAVRPMLDSFCANVLHAGPVGAGQKMKLLHNLLAVGNAVLLAEAFAAAVKAGLDVDTFCDVIATGGAGSTAFQRIRPWIQGDDDGRFGAPLRIARKDLGYCEKLFAELGVAGFMFGAALQTIRLAANAGHAETQITRIVDIVTRMNGAEPPWA